MMGMPMSAEQRKVLDEKIAARKAAVASSLGKTVDELGDSHAPCVDRPAAQDVTEPEEIPDIDEEAVLRYIRTRQEVIDQQRARIRALEAEVRHLESTRALEERKNAALRDALAKLRAKTKEQQSAGEEVRD